MTQSKKTVLVTGANGFVGSHLTEALLARGMRVRCLVRRTGDLKWLPTDRVDLIYGEITRPETLADAVAGVDIVYHLAGLTMASSAAAYHEVNAEGARHLADASSRAGVNRFLHVSSLAAAGPSTREDERRETDPENPTNNYGRSKLAGERAVIARSTGAWTIIRPPAIYGPRDGDFLRLFRLVRAGRMPRLTGTRQRVSLIHARDLVDGIIAASESPVAEGQVYFMTHPTPQTWEKVGALAAEAMGCPHRTVSVPRWVILAVARLVGLKARMAGRSNPYPIDRVRDLLQPSWICDGSKAERDLGFSPRIEIADGIRETTAWYLEAGWL